MSLEDRTVPAPFVVTTTDDSGDGSLRNAVALSNANPGDDTITFAPGLGEIVLTSGQLMISDTTGKTTISGPAGSTQFISRSTATGTPRFTIMRSFSDVELNWLTIRNGSSFGLGGGIFVDANSHLTLKNSVLVNNTADSGGGALYVRGKLSMSATVIENNSSIRDGGGINNFGVMSISGSRIANNSSGNVGGGIYTEFTTTITDSEIVDNTSKTSGGGLRIISSSNTTIINSTISGNSATPVPGSSFGVGGGISTSGNLTLTNSTISGNSANYEGGGISNSGTLTLNHSTVFGNSATDNGGGISNTGTLTVTNTIIAGNLKGVAPNDVNGAMTGTSRNNLIGVDTNLTGVTNGTQGNLIGTAATPLDARLAPLAINGGTTLTHAPLPGSPAVNAGSGTSIPSTDQRDSVRVSGGAIDIGAVELNLSMYFGTSEFAAGSGSGGGTATLYDPDGTVRYTITPFAGFTGGLRTATADFNGDGFADLVVGTGPGRAPRVSVFDSFTKVEIFTFEPFEASFTGGVYVATGDINGDGKPELIVTPDEGGGPRVRVFAGNGFAQIADYYGIDDPNFRGGARASVGDLNGDGKGDLLVAAGFGGGPRVAAYDGARLGSNGGPKLFGDFFAFEQSLRNGIFIAAGDVNGDGFADMVAGGGPGGGPRVSILDGQTLISSGSINPIGNFFAGDINSRGGIRVTVKDLDGDTKADVVVGAGTGAGSRVTAYRGSQISMAGGTPPELFAFDADVGALDGVFVG